MQIAKTALSVFLKRKSTTLSASTVRGRIQVQVRVPHIAPYTKEIQDNYRSTQEMAERPEMIPHLITIITAATVPLGTK